MAYIYSAALYCDECGLGIREELTEKGQAPEDQEDDYSYDSNDFPKYAGEDGGEADCPQHCDACHEFLANPLTREGFEYVKESIAEFIANGRGTESVVREWCEYYDVSLSDIIGHCALMRADKSKGGK